MSEKEKVAKAVVSGVLGGPLLASLLIREKSESDKPQPPKSTFLSRVINVKLDE